MTDCKNCKYTDEYCASGDCTIGNNNLTEQWKKGELPEGVYWVEYSVDGINGVEMMKYIPELNGFSFKIIKQVLAPVPSYEEYEQLENWNRFTADYHALREAKEIAEYEKFELVEQMKQLKELLKEIRRKIKTVYDMDLNQFITSAAFTDDFVKKIDEVLQ